MKYDDQYNQYLYTGASGFVFDRTHLMMEKKGGEANLKVLEIGSASQPHIKWIKDHASIEKYIISEYREVIENEANRKLSEKYQNLEYHYYDEDPNYEQLKGEKFTRIIASHVWEHVLDPEGILLKWVDLLDDDGIISISLPCDPGLAWRLGQKIKSREREKIFGQSQLEQDLDTSREHVNATQRLMKIANYYFNKPNWHFFPFPFIFIVEVNLIVTVDLHKKDFRK